jgi:probable selenium-dependent hydroxylase accessory protein YqeC
MLLSDALGIREHDIVCFVGAGGKTLATMQAARERAAQGRRTLVTTTTKIIQPISTPDETLVLADTLADCQTKVQQALKASPTVVLASNQPKDGPLSLAWIGADYPVKFEPYKLTGVPPEWIEPLAAPEIGAGVILIEADGAAHRMLKAPNNQEPVIPSCATLVVPMADMEALGKPLSEETVHRPLLLGDLAGLPLGSPVSSELIAVALAHPAGGLKSLPPTARAVPLLTTHYPVLRSPGIVKTIRMLLLSPFIHHVVVAYLRTTPVVCEVFER